MVYFIGSSIHVRVVKGQYQLKFWLSWNTIQHLDEWLKQMNAPQQKQQPAATYQAKSSECVCVCFFVDDKNVRARYDGKTGHM